MKLSALGLLLLSLPVAAPAQPTADQLYEQGVAARHAGDHPRSAELLRAAVAADPTNADAHLQLGLALLALGRLDDAERAFRRTLALAPDYQDARIALARVAQRRGDRRAALAELDRVDPENEEVRQLRSQLSRLPGQEPRWRIDVDGSYSLLSQGRADWQEASFRLAHAPAPGTWIGAGIEVARRFEATDVYGEVRFDRRFSATTSGYALIGGTPDALFRPRWQIGLGGTQRLLGGPAPTVLTLDAAYARFPSGDVETLNPGVEQYIAGGRAWLTGRWINVFAEDHQMGWLARADAMAGRRLRLHAGLSDAPETSEGVVIRTFSLFGGLAYESDDRTTVRAAIVHEDRPQGLERIQLLLGVGRRF